MTEQGAMMMFDQREPLREAELDYAGGLFGLKFAPDEQVELYIEDDEWWHHQISFHRLWLADLKSVVDRACTVSTD